MQRKKMLFLFVVFVLLIAGIPAVFAGFQPGTSETTKINLYDEADPGATPVVKGDGQAYIELNDTYGVDETFTVIANVTSVTELRMYAVGVTYDPAILTCTGYGEGEFFYRADAQYRTSVVNQPMPADGSGYLGYYNHMTWVLKKPGNVSGTGTLAWFDFTVAGTGFTKIDIILSGAHVATLADPNDMALDFNTIDIIFDNTGLVVQHELSVSLEAPEVLKVGESSLLNATVENIGLKNETNVELFLFGNGTQLNNVTIPNLVNGTSYTLDYTWTPTVEATYNITAYVVPVPDENSTDNNVATKFVTVPLSYWCISHPVVWDDVTYYVVTCSNATVSDLILNQTGKQIIFNFTAPEYETTGDYWCNVTIPKNLIDAPSDRWVVRAAEIEITTRIVSSNDTHTFIYFISLASEYATEVDVTGTWVVPEFPVATFLLLFMIATLVIVALRKINQPKRKNIDR